MMYSLFVCVLLAHAICIGGASGDNQYDVIIMGAGSSGISAAKTLTESGVTNILVIEAQDYIGGRAKTINFSNYGLNVGASWICGACTEWENCSWTTNGTNPMQDAADEYNISYFSTWDHWDVTLDFGGTRTNLTSLWAAYGAFYEAQNCLHQGIANGTIGSGVLDAVDVSYGSVLAQCGWTEPLSSIEKTVQWYEYEFNALPARDATVFWDLSQETTFEQYGPDYLFIDDPKGYQGVIEGLASEFLDIDDLENEDRITMNSPIATVEYDGDGVTVVLRNGTEYTADYGVATFSIGVLQSDVVDFVPELPSWKRENIQAFYYVDYTPILVKWPYNFWNATVGSPHYLVLNDDRFGFFTWAYILDHPDLSAWSGSLLWRFDVTLDLSDMVQHQSIDDTIQMIVDLKLSHYFDDVPYPDDIFVSDWSTNEFFQGANSHWPVGHSKEELKETVGWPLEGTLFFAGEAVVSDMDTGYVHGAWLSGEQTAYEMLDCMGLASPLECPAEYDSVDSESGGVERCALKWVFALWVLGGAMVNLYYF